MTTRAPNSQDRPPVDASQSDTSDAWRGVIEGLADGQQEEGRASDLSAVWVGLVKQQDELSSLIERAEALEEADRAVRVSATMALEKVKELEASHVKMMSRVRNAELNMAVSAEEVSVLKDQLGAVEELNAQLTARQTELEELVAAADEKVKEATAAEKWAAVQLSETLETLTELSLAKTELEEKLADLERGFEAVKEERAAAEQQWNVSDDQKLSQIRDLRNRVKAFEDREKAFDKEREEFTQARDEERKALEEARKEATSQREALAAAQGESKERIEFLEGQHAESIAKLVDEYDKKLAAAKREIEQAKEEASNNEELTAVRAELEVAVKEREQLKKDLEDTRQVAEKLDELEEQWDGLGGSAAGDTGAAGAAQELEQARAELEGLKQELNDARAGVEQAVADCDRLTADNARLKQSLEESKTRLQGEESSGVQRDLDESSGSHAAELAGRSSSPDRMEDSELARELEAVRAERDEARAELERVRASAEAAEVEVVQLKSTLEATNEELSELKAGRDVEPTAEDVLKEQGYSGSAPGVLISAANPPSRRAGNIMGAQTKRSARAVAKKFRRPMADSHVDTPEPIECPPPEEDDSIQVDLVSPTGEEEGPPSSDHGRKGGSYSLIGVQVETIGSPRRKRSPD